MTGPHSLNRKRHGIFGNDNDRDIGNPVGIGRNAGKITCENPVAVVVILAHRRAGLAWVTNTREGPLRIPPTKFAVVKLGGDRDAVARVLGDFQPKVGGIRRAGRDEARVHERAGGPGVALVDGIAVRVELERAVKMRAGLDGPLPVVRDFTAPENHAAMLVLSLELDPAIERIHGAAGEKVAKLASAHHHFDAHGLAAPEDCADAAERRDEFRRRANRSGRAPKACHGFFAHRKGALELRRFLVRQLTDGRRRFRFLSQGEDVHAQSAFQEFFDGLDLLPPGLVPINQWALSGHIDATTGALVGYSAIARKP